MKAKKKLLKNLLNIFGASLLIGSSFTIFIKLIINLLGLKIVSKFLFFTIIILLIVIFLIKKGAKNE